MAGTGVFQAIRDAAPTLSVGLLTADLLRLGHEVSLLEKSGARLLHFDVMDGSFCPMLTFGAPVVQAVRTNLFKDVHLMVDEPLRKLPEFVRAGADIVTVHAEADRHIHRVFQELGSMRNANDPARGLVRGVALNPGTPLETLDPLLEVLDLVLLLAVNPGWGGQRFGAATPRRLAQARRRIEDSGRDILLGVDGGVTRDNIRDVSGLRPDLI
ncbi:MAG TPA: ribulose-phosphate 3-epimerase, partial [Myxococcota bacterium]